MRSDRGERNGGFVVFLIAMIVLTPSAPVGAKALLTNAAEGARAMAVEQQVLRATNALDYWELESERDGVRQFVELKRFSLTSPPELTATGLDAYFSAVLVGQVTGADAYLIAVVGQPGSAGSGTIAGHSFLAVVEAGTLSVAESTARDFADLYSGRPTDLEEVFGGPVPYCPCEDCQSELDQDMALCTAISFACVTAAAAAGAACVVGCPPCAPLCAVATAAAVAACTLSLAACNRQAVRNFSACEATCNP